MKSLKWLLPALLNLWMCADVFPQYHIEYKFTYYDAKGEETRPIAGDDKVYQDYFIESGRYKSYFDGGTNWIETYESQNNIRNIIGFDGEIAEIKAGNLTNGKMEFIKLDSTADVLGYQCNILLSKSEANSTYYYYNEEVKIDPNSFANHNYARWNSLMNELNGAIPLKYVVTYSDGRYEASAFNVEKVLFEKDDFKPKSVLKQFKLNNVEKLNALKDEIKTKHGNIPQVFSINGEALMSQQNLSIPATVKAKAPTSMYLEISFGGTKFMISSHNGKTWEYNPMEDRVKINDDSNELNGKEDIIGEFIPLVNTDWSHFELISWKELDNHIRVVINLNENRTMFLFNKENYLVEEKATNKLYFLYSDYSKIDNVPFPKKFRQYNYISKNEQMNVHFTNVIFNSEIPDSTFTIPNELRDKIQVVEKQKTAKDYYKVAEDYLQKKEHANAIEYYNKALELDPKNKLYYNQLGIAHLRNDNYYGALSAFNRSVELDKSYAVAWYNLGYVKMQLGDNNSALKDFNKAIELNPENTQYMSYKGMSYYNLEKFDSALVSFNKVIEINSSYNVGYWNVAMAQYRLEMFEEAITNFTNSLEIGYVTSDLYNYRGICYYKLENYNNALEDFKAAIKSKPEVNYYQNLGNSYSELKESKQAIAAFKKALELDPEFAEGHNLIGLEYLNEGSYGAAISSFDAAIKLNKESAVYFDNRGLAKDKKMDFIGAIEDYSRSISLYPDDPYIYYLRGMAKKHIDDKFDACKDLNLASEMGNELAKEEFGNYCTMTSK